jgi:hypothetical protein
MATGNHWAPPKRGDTVGEMAPRTNSDRALKEQHERDERRAALLALLDEAEAADPTPEDVASRASAVVDRVLARVARSGRD